MGPTWWGLRWYSHRTNAPFNNEVGDDLNFRPPGFDFDTWTLYIWGLSKIGRGEAPKSKLGV